MEMPGADPPTATVPDDEGSEGPCPACGGPLFRWVKAQAFDSRRDEEYLLDRCERCGTGVARASSVHPAASPRPEAALEAEVSELLGGLDDQRWQIRLPNRRSLQAAIGEGNWAALELPERPLQLTPAGLAAVLSRLGLRSTSVRTPPLGPNQRWMWQTLLNAFTFEPNFAREALSGRRRPGSGRARLRFFVDAAVSLLAAPLVALVSFPLEAVAALVRRGGEMVVVVEREVGAQQSSESVRASSPGESS